jgi:ubiquinone biosynthesis protein
MTTFDFLRLIYTIYGSKKPDIAYIERMGLLAIKIGQVHALRVDFLDEETCRELTRLYQAVEHISAEEVQSLITQEAPPDFLSHFATFDQAPFASASVGQVHRATLQDGAPVAVKLVKHQYTHSFSKDVRMAQRLFRILTLVYPKLRGVANPTSLLRGIEKTTLAELDMRNEMRGQEVLRNIHEQYRDSFDLRHLAFPRMYPALSNQAVLVSEYVTGETFDVLLSRGALSYDTLLSLFHIHGFFMFVVGTFHGDLHPGNVIQHGEQLYLLDTGYIGTVSDTIRVNLFRYFDALSQYDYPASAQHLHAMSSRALDAAAYHVFQKKYEALYADFTNTTVSQMSLTKKMMQTIRLGVLSGMEFEEGIFDIIKSLMYMDGMVLRCNPQAVLLKDMRQYIDEFKKVMNV